MTARQIDKITRLIAPLLEEMAFELVRVRVTGAARPTLQIMAEREDGRMSAEDCATLSRALSAVLEAQDPIEGGYTLEISSPGIDRPLTRLKDFARWEGHAVKLELNRMVEGRKRFKGVLAGVEGTDVLVDLEGEAETAIFPFDLLAQAKLVLTDALIRDSLDQAKSTKDDMH